MFTVITGGSGSGKSEYAESVVIQYGGLPRFYIATMQPYDAESYVKIARHRRMRQEKQFTTIEAFIALEEVKVPENSVVLLDCMSNLVANEMFAQEKKKENDRTEDVVKKILTGIREILSQCEHLVVVTNEVFSDGLDYDPWTREYIQALGEINVQMAKIAEEVVEVVYSIPIHKKGGRKECD